MELTQDEIKRYGRHLTLPEIGKRGQEKLKNAKILLVGAGGLGSPSLLYLTAAGVGTIGIIDDDKVEFSNLQRQVIHFTDDVGKPKVLSAKNKVSQMNPEVSVVPYEERLNAQNALKIINDYDFVIDGTDNFPTRYLINDACVMLKKPFIYGGIYRFEGQCSIFGLSDGPCYRCFFQEPPSSNEVPSCADAGVLGILPGIIGLLQANEAIKLICEIGKPLNGRLLVFDALKTLFRDIKINKDPQCPMCSNQRTIHELTEHNQTCTTKEASMEENIKEITVQQLKEKLDSPNEEVYVLDVREPEEWEIAKIGCAVLKPLSTIEDTFHDIPKDQPVYVHCKLGGRSIKVIEFLQTQGYDNLYNITGGIDAWSKEIDPTIASY